MDFLDAYNQVTVRTAKKSTIIHTWEKAGLQLYDLMRVIYTMERMEPLTELLTERYYDPLERILNRRTPEPPPVDWSKVETPRQLIAEVQ